ncbi:hypothetical protein GSI_02130 [Ganoderma sinense ZZ0214-1]|uniref:Nitrogen permease regulator 3 n=1 Tax=Ganoderma sinense ZZ0214-1 TaxID=1077348 RepID=A0A2G8SNQ8_9APHY|nr:hypothetical protein GSI_02130 [Ganoderma sinense ZZ0214-1]
MEYYWELPSARRNRAASFTRPTASHPMSRRASPSKDDNVDRDASRLGGLSDEYDTLLGYSAEFLAQILCPQRPMCHRKFELIVDNIRIAGGGSKRRKLFAGKGLSSLKDDEKSTPDMPDTQGEEQNDGSLERSGRTASSDSGGVQTFCFVIVLDLLDPSSSSSRNISKYFDTVYEQITFNVTAVLYQGQITSRYVDKECDVLSSLREDFANREAGFMYEALKVSTIAHQYFLILLNARKPIPGLRVGQHLPGCEGTPPDPAGAPTSSALSPQIWPQGGPPAVKHVKPRTVSRALPSTIFLLGQLLPPFLDSLLQVYENGYREEDVVDEDNEQNTWGLELSFAWTLPAVN